MTRIEFYKTPEGEVMLKDINTGGTYQYSEQDTVFTQRILFILEIFYPSALKGLNKWFSKSSTNRPYFNFLRVRQFILCNFGEYDSFVDLDDENNFHFEFVSCTIRATCLYNGHIQNIQNTNGLAICNPLFESNLSQAELRVMRFYYETANITDDEIAEKLYISVNTVRNHKKNAFRRLDIHSLGQFQVWARKNNLFKN